MNIYIYSYQQKAGAMKQVYPSLQGIQNLSKKDRDLEEINLYGTENSGWNMLLSVLKKLVSKNIV